MLITSRVEDGRDLSMLVWPLPEPAIVASTAACGGGLGERRWIINAQVPHDYRRRDQQQHGAELAAVAGVTPAGGVVMFTAVDVRRVHSREDGGVAVDATVGLTLPVWAAAPDVGVAVAPGTINVVARLPVRLSDAALLNALVTATEAKTQALLEAGVPGTGTASDAVTIVCPRGGPAEPFGGPRSVWGARLARAVHAAVRAGVQ
ncbi:MAG TPA: adenosylcobinamide amidohydrolase [Jatrophihabitantaceae bacterium]|jgi:adenosylcobinamide amidohydrolase